MSLTDEWVTFRQNPTSRTEDRFDFMLMSASGPGDLHRIFEGLPGAEGVIARLEELFSGSSANAWGYQIPVAGNIPEAQAIALATQINANRVAWCRARGLDDLAQELEPLVPEIVDRDTIQAARNDFDHVEFAIGDDVGDYFRDATPDPYSVCRALREAVLMLTKWPDVTAHILAPLWRFDLDFEPAFRLYLGGYMSFAANDRIMVNANGSEDPQEP